jgi:methylated-DNA-[protein]-cysteine S-methyltransferase
MRSTVDKRLQKAFDATYVEEKTDVIEQTVLQLSEYFEGTRTEFDIPLKLADTDFQKSVWETLMTIPFGKTESYLGLSRKFGDEKAIRAVASANRANAISIIVPCHRIIGSNGNLMGYAGGLPAKKKLLTLEGVFNSEQLSLPL